ncbi:hemolysin-iii channel protein [Botrytis cinerea]
MGRPRQHVRQISSATTLIVTREEEEDERDKVKVPEKVLIIGRSGKRDVDVNGDGDVRGEKNNNAESGLGLGLQRNTSGLSMGGLEVLVRDEDIGGVGSEGGDVAVGRFGDANGVEEAGEGEGERIGKVLRWDEVAEWRQDNEFILTGYRPETKSSLRSLLSIFHLHNETINIHSHLLGAVLFALLPLYVYQMLVPRYRDATMADRVVFALFFAGVAGCFALSFLYHTLNNHSHKIASFWIELDYLGIVALMWGSTVATIYHGFTCDVKLQRIYWSMITILSLALTLFTLLPPFRTPFFRPYRTLMYAALGLSAVIFIVHSIVLYGVALQYKRLSLGWIAGMAGLNFLGALAYSLRIPEKYFPGRFDIYGNSHQILHCMVVLAALAHFAGLVQSFDYLHSGGGRSVL